MKYLPNDWLNSKRIDKEQFIEDKSCEISSKRLAKFKEVKQLQKKKYSLRKISRLTGLHRQTVKKYALSKTLPPIIKANKLDSHTDQIAKDWQTGDYTKKAIWEKLQRNRHKGSYSEVTRFIRQLDGQPPQISLSPRQAKWLLCYPPGDGKDVEKLSRDRQLEKYLLGSCEDIKAVANAARRFIQIIIEKSGEAFDQWLVDVSRVPSIKNFAQGLKEDYSTVKMQ